MVTYNHNWRPLLDLDHLRCVRPRLTIMRQSATVSAAAYHNVGGAGRRIHLQPGLHHSADRIEDRLELPSRIVLTFSADLVYSVTHNQNSAAGAITTPTITPAKPATVYERSRTSRT